MKTKIRARKKITAFDAVVYAIGIALLLIVGYPLILVLSNSFSSPQMVATGQVLFLPKGINLEGYKAVFQDSSILTGYANTIFYTVCKTLLGLAVTLPAGYAMTKSQLPGRNFFMAMFMITMYFSGGLIPTFLQMQKYGLYNTRWAIILMGVFSTYNCIICRSFFAGLPKELEEAAKVDGCNYFRTFFSIMMPLSKPIATTVVIMETIWTWNAFMLPLVLTLNNPASRTLAVGLYAFKGENTVDWTGIAAGGTIAVIPIILLFIFLQKYFVEGIAGAVKS